MKSILIPSLIVLLLTTPALDASVQDPAEGSLNKKESLIGNRFLWEGDGKQVVLVKAPD